MDTTELASPGHVLLQTPKGGDRPQEPPPSQQRQSNAFRFVPTLLWKNWWLKKKHPFPFLMEILTPVLFLVVLSVIKHQTTEYNVSPGFSDDNNANNLFSSFGYSLIAPLFTPQYVIPETTLTGLMLHMAKLSFVDARDMQMFVDEDAKVRCEHQVIYGGRVSLNQSSPYAVPKDCQGHVSPYKLAIAPDNAFTRAYFYETVKDWYPTLEINLTVNSTLVVPSFEDSVIFYDTEEALEEYVKSENYAKTTKQPRIYGAIVFNELPGDNNIGSYAPIDYSIRINATYVGRSDDEEKYYVPRTVFSDASSWWPFRRSLKTVSYIQYASGGFMTLQTLVARFVNCMPKWDAKTKSTKGECQATSSRAISSSALDDRFLATVAKDPATKQIIAEMTQDSSIDSSTLASLVSSDSIELPLTDSQREALLKPLRQAPQPYFGATTSPFPIASYSRSTFYDVIKDVFSFIFILSYLTTLSKILVSLIAERETRSRELMKILGVKESSIVISWYVTYIAILLISSIFQAIAAKAGLFEHSDGVLLFLFFFLFGLSVLSYGFMLSSIFSTARTGAFVGIIGFFIMHAVVNAFNDSSSESSKNAASVLSPTALAFAIGVLSEVETSHVGIHFSNASSTVNHYRFGNALWMFAFDSILYTIIGLYLEKVVPKTHGTTEKWYFPVMPSYWRRRRQAQENGVNLTQNDGADLDVDVDVMAVQMDSNIEPVSADLVEQELRGEVLRVSDLRKVFQVPGGEKVAVDGLQLNMYSGQITCLLGHNGAGKTTLISMLTGMLAPTAGDATFRGLSIRKDMDEIRESLGICFQHDVLYPELTVEEHLQFYARIKGYSGTELNDEVTQKINEVGLSDKRKTISSSLSGGMKRKLSVAISLLGDSSLVFLDEPTSGMDPYSRRSTWEILMNNRHNRVLVLTTHFMDEADILGDRIAIMAEGQLRCCGSSLFLKNRYGAGYNLTIVKEEGCNDTKVMDFVLGRISSGKVLSNVGTEIAFQLPLDASTQFPELFRALDKQLKHLQILTYGISVTTMEEVFIKVAEAANDEDVLDHQKLTLQNKMKAHQENRADTNSSTSDCSTPTGQNIQTSSLFSVQFVALFQKRYRIAKRDKRFGLLSLFAPIAWLIFGLSVLNASTLTKTDPIMPMNVDHLAREVKGHQVLLPSFCDQLTGDWCDRLFSSRYFTGSEPTIVGDNEIGNPPYDSNSPTVFGVKYTTPSINRTDSTGYLLKLSQVVYDRGVEQGVDNQFGGFLARADSKSGVLSYSVLVNTSLDHGSAVFKSQMDQAIYRVMASEVSPEADVSKLYLKVNSYPLPQTASTTSLFSSYLAFTACLFIAVAFSYYPAAIVTLLVKERQVEHNSKHQQLVSGVNLLAFWLANYVWDLLVFILPGGAALILIQAYKLSSLTGSSECLSCTSETFPTVIVLFVVFGFAICPFAYCLSFFFSNHASAQTKVIMLNLLLGLALMIVSFVLDVIDSTKSTNRVLKWFFRLSPIYDLSTGLLDLTILAIVNTGGGSFDKERSLNPFALENAGYEIMFLVLDAVLFFSITIAIDYALTFPRVKSMLSKDPHIEAEKETEDEDVAAETERVVTSKADTDVIKLQNLRKVYPEGAKVAVKNLSFGLKRGECFGFLGINGAGKTTTMKMLTGDIVPTSGSATLAGFDILSQQIDIRREIGYCPQFDALIDLLSVREHLELFAQIKGVPRSELDEVVREKMQQLNLTAFEHKLAGSLSGGNKRKLSVAIAMIGSPSILFLDEPSTGMDPVSRRFMWDVISEISTYNKQSTVVLTTHSMEECEALCTRVGIMVGGGLKCLGSVQHLKHRFGDGLMFDAKLLPAPVSEVESLVLRHFDSLDARISALELSDVCRRFGESAWEEKLVETHPTGFLVASALRRDGYVLAGSFASWWLTEVRFAGVERFLSSNFARVELLERQNDSCWFKLHEDADDTAFGAPQSSESLHLANVFDLIESSKASLAIREYSVSQTTLEQIFNTFASQQHQGEAMATTPTNSPA
ncbi:hypothetical protein Poli38472_000034 [Pythium oligandrum]|uniref:ABC transporter domain-containing protein n=1 Tax=Pythium oligandrum TaxID=41045 RepID=A0A8K1CB82_PYTOL|nr:hypothetical protein Poli38472_000034 [Pythium oligandrum]|eukprot:TMW59992.1 hypothetical protein Poli38472_000034 [Pythium oligandrum]